MKEDAFKDYVLDQLRDVPRVKCRSMFDGYGIYSYDTLFGIIFEDKLYFKTSKQTVADYREAGMKALEMNKHQKLKNFYEVPLSVLEDREALMQWADRAIQ